MATLPGLQHMPARTAQSITDLAGLRVELQSVLGRGYAVDDQEYQPNVRCIAVPIRNAQGAVVALCWRDRIDQYFMQTTFA